MFLPCFFPFLLKISGSIAFPCMRIDANNTTLLINYINLAAKEKVWELLLRKSLHTNTHTYGRFKNRVMRKHENRCQAWESTLKVAGKGKPVASSIQRISLQNQTRANVQSVARATNMCSSFCNIAAKRD